LLLLLAAFTGWFFASLFERMGLVGTVLEITIVAVFLAQKSLADHVSAVAQGLRDEGLAGGRRAVAMIVGRDPEALDEAGVSRAAIESLAENFSDGIVAPVFWYAVLGFAGPDGYKMLNTADSMIGHLNDRHRDFGRAAARMDDVANWPAARISAFLIAIGAGITKGGAAMQRAIETVLVGFGTAPISQCRMARGGDGGGFGSCSGRAAALPR
jgi:adenosylcobinamide-phosphate synthase